MTRKAEDIAPVVAHFSELLSRYGSYRSSVRTAYNVLSDVARDLGEKERVLTSLESFGPIDLNFYGGRPNGNSVNIGFMLDEHRRMRVRVAGVVVGTEHELREKCTAAFGETDWGERKRMLDQITRTEVLDQLANFKPGE